MTFESILTYISINWEKCLWTFVASMLAVIGTGVAIATYKSSKHLWVMIVVTFFIISNIFYVAAMWEKNLTARMVITIISWGSFLMYHWLFAMKYLTCSFKIPVEVEKKIIQPSTPRLLKSLNIAVSILIITVTCYSVTQTLSTTKTPKEKLIAQVVLIIPYFVISIVCCIALFRIRSYFKSLGLGHRMTWGRSSFTSQFSCSSSWS